MKRSKRTAKFVAIAHVRRGVALTDRVVGVRPAGDVARTIDVGARRRQCVGEAGQRDAARRRRVGKLRARRLGALFGLARCHVIDQRRAAARRRRAQLRRRAARAVELAHACDIDRRQPLCASLAPINEHKPVRLSR